MPTGTGLRSSGECELLSATHAGRRSSLSRSGSRCCPASRLFREWHGLLYASATALGMMMTELEEKVLEFYLGRVGVIVADGGFEAWYRQRHLDADAEALYKDTLDRAQAFAAGYRQACVDFRLQVLNELEISEPASRGSLPPRVR